MVHPPRCRQEIERSIDFHATNTREQFASMKGMIEEEGRKRNEGRRLADGGRKRSIPVDQHPAVT